MLKAQAILETVLYAGDLDAAEAFYTQVFGLEVVQRLPGKFVFLKLASQMLLIFHPTEAARPDPGNPIPRHGAMGAGHLCFRAEDAADVARWHDHFTGLGVAIETDFIWSQSGARSLYIRDPAGNSVEVGEARMWGLAPPSAP